MNKRKNRPRNKQHKSSGVSKIGPNSNSDVRLTHASLLLSYAFEWGVDFRRRIINLTGEVNDDMYELLDAALTEMEADGRSTVTLKINSEGGSVLSALAIVGRIKESACYIVTKGYGSVSSAATIILAAGDRRKMSRFGWFMHHEMSYELGYKRHSDAKSDIRQAEREEQEWATHMEEFTGTEKEFWARTGTGADVYFTALELLKLGVIDEVF